jgi:hypothetical protein
MYFLLFTDTNEVTGSNNLMSHYGLEHAYSRFCKKEGKETGGPGDNHRPVASH